MDELSYYADTDFLLALAKETDWLKSKAKQLLDKYKGKIWTSIATIIEILLVSKRENLDLQKLLISLYGFISVKGITLGQALDSAEYIENYNFGVFDSLHASLAGQSPIISSDSVFDKIGINKFASFVL